MNCIYIIMYVDKFDLLRLKTTSNKRTDVEVDC